MPTNLPAEVQSLYDEYLSVPEGDIKRRIELLEKLIALTPKHKGTEKLLKQRKTKLAKLREELRKQEERRRGGKDARTIRKTGDLVATVIYFSDVSRLIERLGGEVPKNAPVNLTLDSKGALIQLVVPPPIYPGLSESSLFGRYKNLFVNADVLVFIIYNLEELRQIAQEIKAMRIIPMRRPKVIVEKRAYGGVQFNRPVSEGLKDYAETFYRNAYIRIEEEVPEEIIKAALDPRNVFKPAVFMVPEGLIDKIRLENVPVVKLYDLESLGEAIIKAAGYMRIYTKTPDGKVSNKATLMPIGSTVGDLVERLEGVIKARKTGRIEARVRGRSVKFPGQRVGKNHVLMDGDVVRLLSI